VRAAAVPVCRTSANVDRLFWRAYRVLSKPSDELISLLGLEVPVPPALSLAGIRADGLILNWKPPEQQKTSIVKHHINVNGVSREYHTFPCLAHAKEKYAVGELSPQETSIAVSGLRPDNNYIVRVVAVNPLNFQAASEAIRVQTKPASSRDFFQSPNDHDGNPTSEGDPIPGIRPFKALLETQAPAPPAMNREHSGSVSQPKRGRRVSPIVPTEHSAEEQDEHDRDGVGLRELTEKLDRFRGDIDAAEQDLTNEEKEFECSHAALNEQKKNFKQAVADKENASKALKKQVADLGSQNMAAQSKRTAAEKRFEHKLQERQKLKDDVDKWDREIAEMHAEAERLAVEGVSYREAADDEVAKLREEHEERSVTNKALEESLRLIRSKIEELKTEKERLTKYEPEIARGLALTTPAEDVEWGEKINILQHNYQIASTHLQGMREYGLHAQAVLDQWRQRRSSQPQLFISAPIIDFIPPARRHSQRRSRALSLRNNDHSPHGMTFDMASGPPYNSSISSISPPYSTASPYFNALNGMSFPVEHMANGMSQAEVDALTAGAPTSPSVAGALLPAGLLGDDMDISRYPNPEPSSNRSSPLNANILPGLGAFPTLEQNHHRPSSPSSPQSRSPSVFASPRVSSTHLPFHHGPDSLMDSDKRSVRSTTSSMRNISGTANTTTRFAKVFGFNRQRGKTFSDEGPTLGSLRSQESQSFPRQDNGDQTNPFGRRRGSHSGNWMDQWHSVLSRNSAPAVPGADGPTQPKSMFRVFGSKTDDDRPESPRPESAGSNSESLNMLPKPSESTQSRFGWPAFGDSSTNPLLGAARHPTTLAPDWAVTTTNSWSRHPSRRPSIQYGQGPPSFIDGFLDSSDMADFQDGVRRRSPKLAPIGTRPASQISTGSAEKPKLNPAAPSFRINTLFTRDKKEKGDKSEEKAERKKSKKGKDKKKEEELEDLEPPMFDNSEDLLRTPMNKQWETYNGDTTIRKSMSTAGDTEDSRDSLERTTSRTPSDFASGPKETFMQKLTRKSSASMFNFPSFGKDKKLASGKKSVQGTPDFGAADEVDDEDGGLRAGTDAQARMSRSYDNEKGGLSPLVAARDGRESKDKDRSSGGFSFRSLKGRKKGEKTPSLHESVASGEEADEMEHGEWTTL
jgi:predicted  nucleic acid-binding Zn-ribbon protein